MDVTSKSNQSSNEVGRDQAGRDITNFSIGDSSVVNVYGIAKEDINKTEKFWNLLLNEPAKELGLLFSETIKSVRLKNLLKISSMAYNKLNERGIRPFNISIKLAHSLIEYSSLEEDEYMQELWSNLLVSTDESLSGEMQKRLFIDILNKLSQREAKLLNEIFHSFEESRHQLFIRWKKVNNYENPEDVGWKSVLLCIDDFESRLGEDTLVYFEALIALDLLNWLDSTNKRYLCLSEIGYGFSVAVLRTEK